MPPKSASQSVQPPPAAGSTLRGAWRRDLAWLLLILGIALAVRIVYVYELRRSPVFDDLEMDPLFHHQWAKAFAQGKPLAEAFAEYRPGVGEEPYFRAPLYTWFLGTLYWLFGAASLPARLVQAGLSAANCVLLFLIGRRFFNRTVGVVAGLLAAGYWLFVYYDAELLSPVLIVFLNLLLIWVLLEAGARTNVWLWGIAGILLGLSAIARPDILLLAPLLVVWQAVLYRPRWRRVAGYAVMLALGTLLPILPITVRNYVVGHDRVLIASYGGVNFYIGNNPGADGMTAIIPGDPPEWWPCFNAQVARAEAAEGRKLKPSEVSAWYTRAAWKYIFENPGEALGRMVRKLGYFWSWWEVSNNQDIRFSVEHYTPVARYLPFGFWVVGPLGLVGAVLALRRGRALFPLWALLLVYIVAAAAFFVTARYRIPAAVVLVLFAAYAVDWGMKALRAKRWGAVGGATLGLLAIAAIVAQTPPGVDRGSIQGYRFAGFTLARQGHYAEAEPLLMESIAREQPWQARPLAKARNSLGKVRMNLDKYAAAAECFEQALAIDPAFAEARQNYAVTLSTLKRAPEALNQYRILVQLDPNNGEYHAQLAAALWSAQMPDAARAEVRRAVELAPNRGQPHALSGLMLASAGQIDAALPELQRALELDPNSAELVAEAATRVLQQNRPEDAVRILRAGLERSPENLRLLVRLVQVLVNAPDPALRQEAVRLAQQAVRVTEGKDALTLYAAAKAMWAVGQDAPGTEAARKALELFKRTQPGAPLIGVIEQELRAHGQP